MKIHIKNGRLVDPANGIDAQQDVYIAAGRIAAVAAAPEGFVANRVIDAAGLVVCPGLIDLSARLREPGFEYKATLESEMAAAAAGGVTSLACPPDTDPPLDEPGLVEMLKHRARHPNFAHVYPVGALTLGLAGERLTEMAELHEAGCIAFGQANMPVVDTQVLMRALQYAATFDYPVWLQAQDPFLGKDGVAHDGEVATRLGLSGMPVSAETIAIATILQLARDTGVRVHLTRISSAAALEMIAAARSSGIAVTCDVSINHLHLSDQDIGYFNPHAHLVPPLRAGRDRDALRRGLADGTINALCSDHTPVDDDAKQVPFSEAEPGATGLELLLPLTLKWAAEMRLPLGTALARITTDSARILGLPAGTLTVGAAADVCVFDPHGSLRVTRDKLKSQGKNTPFLGMELPGRVRYTLLDGHVAYESRP
ncbi:MAG: dihydroorotase [Rhodocyclaceae bacterium]|jgi:dihydroorotase|uniref:Dihydroorotase n=1 Tax=Candidatus Desulfobacillus denitrificans TaxID=2608985 RepID=A0A809R3Q7_9PROT|nr:dihydroorotase [Rhodocyclaceae bacterium]MCZ2175524.1 dihydroorotase [Burkholderiales bacterium]OQY75504.1 MAG: dihydroorotase [Rhodocyclaceae bacterium UTPRO2]BBO22169.1 dihydroorotase [Candidatus Desulfobacillus denitrificans]GIK47036.1 MAG: dihydroorotase [Betaproteobacteria bacterium]